MLALAHYAASCVESSAELAVRVQLGCWAATPACRTARCQELQLRHAAVLQRLQCFCVVSSVESGQPGQMSPTGSPATPASRTAAERLPLWWMVCLTHGLYVSSSPALPLSCLFARMPAPAPPVAGASQRPCCPAAVRLLLAHWKAAVAHCVDAHAVCLAVVRVAILLLKCQQRGRKHELVQRRRHAGPQRVAGWRLCTSAQQRSVRTRWSNCRRAPPTVILCQA
eukprot:29023-Chlamydomonas_euryale.AAC.12